MLAGRLRYFQRASLGVDEFDAIVVAWIEPSPDRMRPARFSFVEADLRLFRSLQSVIGNPNYRGVEPCFIRVEELNNTTDTRRVQQLENISTWRENDRRCTGYFHRLIDSDSGFLVKKLASRRSDTECQQHHSEAKHND